jgi:predicted DNA-binding transcriptional regulator AlpA
MLMIVPNLDPECQLVGIKTVCRITEMGERTIEKLLARGEFPAPLPNRYTKNRRWRLSHVLAWVRDFGTDSQP